MHSNIKVIFFLLIRERLRDPLSAKSGWYSCFGIPSSVHGTIVPLIHGIFEEIFQTFDTSNGKLLVIFASTVTKYKNSESCLTIRLKVGTVFQ